MATTLKSISSGNFAESRPLGARDHDLWARVSTISGAAVWAGLAVLARVGAARIGAIELLFLFAPLVIVPLGLELGRRIGGSNRLAEIAYRKQPVGAALAVWAMWLPPGRVAGIVAGGWFVVCLLMAGAGVIDLLLLASRLEAGRTARSTPARSTLSRVALGVARIDLAIGGAWLVASRLGMRPMGIQEPIGLLTAVHFHFAGFATATIAAATLRFAEGQGRWRALRWVVPFVIAMPFLVAAGFVFSPALKMGAGIAFSASVMALAIIVRACSLRMQNTVARRMLQFASAAVFAGMVLSTAYAVTDFRGSDLLPIPQMARTHGVLNAVGFCMMGLLGWLVEQESGHAKLPQSE